MYEFLFVYVLCSDRLFSTDRHYLAYAFAEAGNMQAIIMVK